ncbi:unnamed protein product [Aureobasidium mustum]|uniref:Uncharacterized protein n=1 Tax=Aureobasidium mustum TaxID=2773714 RepID=A0A9N8K688_9PEZI|nr:unnamed protein product [Aureobasidium mustum]
MSSDPSVTVRADSGEPPAKRQKTFDYGVDTHWEEGYSGEHFKTVAVVNATRFYRATKDRFRASQASMTHDGTEVMDADMTAVLKACDGDDADEDHWIHLLFQVIEFWLRNDLDQSVHDQMVDCSIDGLRAEKNQGSDIAHAITTANKTVHELPSDRIPMLRIGSNIVDILACLSLYHNRQSLGPWYLHDRFDEEDLGSDIDDEAYRYLLAGWGDASKYPQDPLKDEFDQHCRYHLHGDEETCYKRK